MPPRSRKAPTAKATEGPAGAAYVLKVTLRGVKPPIWRRLQIASDLTVRDLHHALQVAKGWSDSHLHEFKVDGSRYGMPDPQCRHPSETHAGLLRLVGLSLSRGTSGANASAARRH